MGFSKSQSPSGTSLTYPFPLTYLILGTSVLCSSVSTGLLGYFVYYLNMDSMSVPWEFILVSSFHSHLRSMDHDLIPSNL